MKSKTIQESGRDVCQECGPTDFSLGKGVKDLNLCGDCACERLKKHLRWEEDLFEDAEERHISNDRSREFLKFFVTKSGQVLVKYKK